MSSTKEKNSGKMIKQPLLVFLIPPCDTLTHTRSGKETRKKEKLSLIRATEPSTWQLCDRTFLFRADWGGAWSGLFKGGMVAPPPPMRGGGRETPPKSEYRWWRWSKPVPFRNPLLWCLSITAVVVFPNCRLTAPNVRGVLSLGLLSPETCSSFLWVHRVRLWVLRYRAFVNTVLTLNLLARMLWWWERFTTTSNYCVNVKNRGKMS